MQQAVAVSLHWKHPAPGPHAVATPIATGTTNAPVDDFSCVSCWRLHTCGSSIMHACSNCNYVHFANCELQTAGGCEWECEYIYIYIYMLSGSRVGGTFTCMSCENNDRVVGKGVFIKPFCQKKS